VGSRPAADRNTFTKNYLQMNRIVFFALLFAAGFTLFHLPLAAQDRSITIEALRGQRNALLVGVDKYETLEQLRYCGCDVYAAKSLLADSGFQEIVVMTTDSPFEDKQPTLKNIEKQLADIINATPVSGTVLIMLSGHGFSQNGTSFYCPKDTNCKNLARS